jgi:hypothetical protein
MSHYLLDENGKAKAENNDEVWMRWFHENVDKLVIAKTPIVWHGDLKTTVVTKFDYTVDINHMHGNVPLVWVTKEEGDDDRCGTRTAEMVEALQVHKRIVELKYNVCKAKYPDRRKNKVKRVVTNLINKIMEQ